METKFEREWKKKLVFTAWRARFIDAFTRKNSVYSTLVEPGDTLSVNGMEIRNPYTKHGNKT
jgi:hypothetical protein